MKPVSKLEVLLDDLHKKVPHLPVSGQKWLGQNVWWIALIGAISSGIAILASIALLFTVTAYLNGTAPINAFYYAAPLYSGWSIVTILISIALLGLVGLLLALSVMPLKERTKKGWTLLFMALLAESVGIVVTAIISLSVLNFIESIIFGGIGMAIGAYFIFEIRSQFAHSTHAKKK